MGKSLRGKECGKGICQRKDGLYYARFVDKTGRRHEKYLPTLPEARNYYQLSICADTKDRADLGRHRLESKNSYGK